MGFRKTGDATHLAEVNLEPIKKDEPTTVSSPSPSPSVPSPSTPAPTSNK